MTQAKRRGSELDICPNCRGVWLDRGEPEKLLEPLRSEAPRDDFYRRDHGYSHHDDDHDDHHGCREHDDYRHGRRGRRSILDIFD
jgi:Zn-finger nucleic acid-binding protein